MVRCTGASCCISRLDEYPNDRDQQHGSESDYGDLEVGGSVCGEYRPVHGVLPESTLASPVYFQLCYSLRIRGRAAWIWARLLLSRLSEQLCSGVRWHRRRGKIGTGIGSQRARTGRDSTRPFPPSLPPGSPRNRDHDACFGGCASIPSFSPPLKDY